MSDGLIHALAARQHGVVFREQCLRLGISAKQLRQRVECGAWRRLHRGVYAIGHVPLGDHGRYLAAVFACGPGAALAYRSAASLWGLQPHHPGWPHVTSPVARARRRGVVAHRSRRIDPADVTVRHGVPVTTLARTVVDLADPASPEEVETAIRAAERLHGFDRALLVPIPGRRGTRRLRPPATFTRGQLEKLLIRVVRRFGLAMPDMNVAWNGLELDAVWWDAGVVLEVDDWDTHRHRDAFERDRRRDRVLHVAGLRPLRCTYVDLTDEVERLVAELRLLGVPAASRRDG